jgi:hypothetical protein
MSEGICVQGMWLSEEVLLSKSTLEKKFLGKLKRQGLLQCERAAHVSNSNNRGNPFSSLTFYYVKASGDPSGFCFPAAADIKVPLSEFIHMCDSLEKFVLGNGELSRGISDRLQKYTGVTILLKSSMRCTGLFTTLIVKLQKENYIMFSIDMVSQTQEKNKQDEKATKAKEEKERVEKQQAEKEKEQAEMEQAEEELREKEQADKDRILIGRLVRRPPESGAKSARSAEMDIYGLLISFEFAHTVECLPDSLKGNRIGTLFLLDSVVSLQEQWIKQFLISRLPPPPATTDAVKQKVHTISEV